MKRTFLLFLILLSISALAQVGWPEPFVINENFKMYERLPEENWQYLETGDKKLKLNDVLTDKYAQKFAAYEHRVDNFDTRSQAWVRYRLKNASANPQIITFSIDNSREYVYVQRDGKWLKFVSGTMVPWSERSSIKQLTEIKFTLRGGEEVKVVADVGQVSMFNRPRPEIGNYLQIVDFKFIEKQTYNTDDVISFGFFGFIMFAVIFNLFFYYVNREKVYLVYSSLLFFSALLMAENIFSSLAFSEFRSGYIFFMFAVISLFIIMLIHTVRFFFRVNIHFPGWDKFLTYFTVYIGISGTLIYISYVYQWLIMLFLVIGIAALAGMVFIVAAIVLIISLLRKKDKEARLFVIAAMPFIASPIISAILPFEWTITVCGMWTILALSWGMFARFKSLQAENARAALEKEEERNRLIAAQKIELEELVKERTRELSQSLTELKQTQNQLVQSEKMASLGELTAGIAHEIQNPLNFVNNFSDVSVELLEEMSEEMDKGDTEEAKAIAGDIKQNLEKIAHHGRRADSIVKGMLQHSRASTGQKEPTDINALADEYLRLAYHGLRAKDKSFNAELIVNFDSSLPKVNVISQDIGRVLLNLFTNAFYAMQQKQKKLQSADYKPTVELTTQIIENSVEIRVKDNGTGIPDAIKDKILQPFFTTKPTGEGTGLGLSLSYDIVVKAHGGKIEINSIEGEGALFIISLPFASE
ncbi:MAG: sensor histidine kinase [Flavobacterium sp.]